MKRELLTETQLNSALMTLNGWTAEENRLRKRYGFDNFADALAFVNTVGELAEAADHHPDICLGWGYANLELATHDRNGITDTDIALARRIDAI